MLFTWLYLIGLWDPGELVIYGTWRSTWPRPRNQYDGLVHSLRHVFTQIGKGKPPLPECFLFVFLNFFYFKIFLYLKWQTKLWTVNVLGMSRSLLNGCESQQGSCACKTDLNSFIYLTIITIFNIVKYLRFSLVNCKWPFKRVCMVGDTTKKMSRKHWPISLSLIAALWHSVGMFSELYRKWIGPRCAPLSPQLGSQ